jgi:hypothetical protein
VGKGNSGTSFRWWRGTGIGAPTSETICLIFVLRRWLGFQFGLRKGFRKVHYIHVIEQSLVPSSSLVYWAEESKAAC